MRKLSTIALFAAVLMFLTRWPLVPKEYLYHMDNVNFALALDDFNPVLHQPQPPGDPLFVGLIRLIRLIAPKPEVLLPLTGLLGSVLVLVVMWQFGTSLFDSYAGLASMVLLALNPIFWLAGVGNYVRVYLALGSVTVAWLAWRCWQAKQPMDRLWFYASAAALGFFAGFRPELGLLIFPLVASCIWRRRFQWTHVIVAAFCLAVTAVPWIVVTAYETGGMMALYRLNSAYLAEHSRHTSLIYGATFQEGFRMWAGALYWIFLGVASWFWVLLWRRPEIPRMAAIFLALWFIPPFLFHMLIHINNPDHALVEIPVVCIAGGVAVAAMSPRSRIAALCVAALINVVLFFYPTQSPYWASNYRIVQYTNKYAREVYESLLKLRAEGALTVLWKDSLIAPQEMKYYVPGTVVVNLGNQLGSEAVRISPGNIAWLDPISPDDQNVFQPLRSDRKIGPLNVMEVNDGSRFTLNGNEFLVTATR